MNIYDIKIGDVITPEKGLELCRHFKLNHIIRRIENNLDDYKSFEFDGCSLIPDELLGLFTNCKWQNITYLCCLPHDLEYAYGESGDEEGKLSADLVFKHNLLFKAHMKEWLAVTFLVAVDIGGTENLGLSFSWSFARKKSSNDADV